MRHQSASLQLQYLYIESILPGSHCMRVLALAMNQNGSKQGRGRGPSALDDAVYNILLGLLVNAYTCAPNQEDQKKNVLLCERENTMTFKLLTIR